MATNHTEKYELNRWLPTDPVIRTDFNEDNAKIEAALADIEDRMCEYDTLMAVATILGQTNNALDALEERVAALENA